MRQSREGKGHRRQWREVIGVLKPATARWAPWVRKAARSSVRASRPQWGPLTTPLPLPHRRHRNRCPCSECCVRREFSTTGEVSFPAKAALAVERRREAPRWGGGRVVVTLPHRRRRTVDYQHSVPAAGGTIWVVPRGGADRTADGE